MQADGLIITADDFGAAIEVNDAVEIAHRQGVLTAASLMVGAPAADDAVERARRLPRLGVGLHLVLIDGVPTLPPERIPHLVGRDGRFRDDIAAAATAMAFLPAARRELAAEIEAQFQAFARTGLALDHVNAHKHFHLHQTIAAFIARIGPRYGLRAARSPFEPRAVIQRAEPNVRAAAAPVVDACAALVRARFRAVGVMGPDAVLGLRWSGAVTADRLAALIAQRPPGLTEIYLHPATGGGFAGAAAGYLYEEEFAALTAPAVLDAVRASGVRTGAFAEFADLGPARTRAPDDQHALSRT